MGICCSSYESEPETASSTAKVIHQDGLLQEFDYPVKVSHVIDPRETFICNSDEMDFGDVASPVSSDDTLQLGQLYFALPVCRLSQPLPADEMAKLAVKAYQVLMKYGGGGSMGKCGCRSKMVTVSEEGKDEERESTTNVVVSGKKRKKKGVTVTGRCRRKVFAANLSTIEE